MKDNIIILQWWDKLFFLHSLIGTVHITLTLSSSLVCTCGCSCDIVKLLLTNNVKCVRLHTRYIFEKSPVLHLYKGRFVLHRN